jgi:hypothetical protein
MLTKKKYLIIICFFVTLICNSCLSNSNYNDELKIIDRLKSKEVSREYITSKSFRFTNNTYILESSRSEFTAYDINKNLINKDDHLIYDYDSNRVLRTKYEVYTRGPGYYYFYKYTYHYDNNKLSQIRFVKSFDMDSNFVFAELSYNSAGEIIKETNHKGFYTKTTIIYSHSQKISEIDSEYNFSARKILVYAKKYFYKKGLLIKSIEEHLFEDYKKYTFYTYGDNGNLVITKDTTVSDLPIYKYPDRLKASYSVAFNKTESYYKNNKLTRYITYGPDYKTPFNKIEYSY